MQRGEKKKQKFIQLFHKKYFSSLNLRFGFSHHGTINIAIIHSLKYIDLAYLFVVHKLDGKYSLGWR
jgi:hypothetical protein